MGLDSNEFRTIMGMKRNISNERLVSDMNLNLAWIQGVWKMSGI